MSGSRGEEEEQPANKSAAWMSADVSGCFVWMGETAGSIELQLRHWCFRLTEQHYGDGYEQHEDVVVADERHESPPSCCESDFCHLDSSGFFVANCLSSF